MSDPIREFLPYQFREFYYHFGNGSSSSSSLNDSSDDSDQNTELEQCRVTDESSPTSFQIQEDSSHLQEDSSHPGCFRLLKNICCCF